MQKQHWFKRDMALLQRIKDVDEKLKTYFKDKNGQISNDSKTTIYDRRAYHRWIKNEMKRLEDKIHKTKMNGYKLKNYQYKGIEEKLGFLMHKYEMQEKRKLEEELVV